MDIASGATGRSVLVTLWQGFSPKEVLEYEPEMGYDVLAAQIESALKGQSVILLNSMGLQLSEYKNDVLGTCTYDPLRGAQCLDIYCVSTAHRDASGACSRRIGEIAFGIDGFSEDLVQPLYKVVDTDIRLCGHCASQCTDPSLLVYEPHAIQAFACSAQKAAEFGMLPSSPSHLLRLAETTAAAGVTDADHSTIVKSTRGDHPVNIYFKRCLMNSAILAQTSGGFIGMAPLASTPPLAAAQLAQQREAQALFTRRVQAARQTALMHEEESHQHAARAAIDYARVLREAQLWQDEQTKAKGKAPAADAVFLAGLLAWFKRHFFKWCNKPLCQLESCPAARLSAEHTGKCADDMSSIGMLPPTPDELVGAASRVEGYSCRHCNTTTRFPRFNDPTRLLQTRTGRCGEWANCFGLICRSLGLDSRYIMDFTDHVWIEVWLESEGRYCHCDPCENCLDAPLTYEHGWGKKLTYVLSVSRHGCVDATAKYSRQLATVLERRGALGSGVQEGWVRQELSAADEQLRTSWQARASRPSATGHLRGAVSSSPPPPASSMEALMLGAQALESYAKEATREADEVLEHRSMCLKRELAALTMWSGNGDWKLAEMLGRVSGDEKWRRSRGEIGAAKAAAEDTD